MRTGAIFGDSSLYTFAPPPDSGAVRVRVAMSTMKEGWKSTVHKIIFPNGVTGTIFLRDSSFDSGLEGYAVF